MDHVLYYSLTGNTRKMAAAIAAELGVEARPIKLENEIPREGLLFLGSGSYGDRPSEDMSKFVARNDLTGQKVALFGTSGRGEGKEVQGMEELLKRKGAIILGSYYSKGKAFVIINIGHPNRDELEGARNFAREMAQLG